MSEHTPGPWSYFYPAGNPDGFRITAVEGVFIGRIAAPADMESGRANARLTAAAPELLSALKLLVSAVERDDNPSDEGHYSNSDEMMAARSVIAKAEGR